MPDQSSPFGTPEGMPGFRSTQRGKYSAPHFNTLAEFQAAFTPGSADNAYSADQWRDKQEMSLAIEPRGVKRSWSIAAGHARTVLVGTVSFVLQTNDNVVLETNGPPSNGAGSNGDYAVDGRAAAYYGPKRNNLWPLPNPTILGAPRPAYLGPITGRSNAPRNLGGIPYSLTFSQWHLLKRANMIAVPFAFYGGQGESVKGNSPQTNGHGDVYVSVIQDGVAYPLFTASGGSTRVGVSPYGDLVEMFSNTLPRYFEAGEFITIAAECAQTSHTDGQLAGQVFQCFSITEFDVCYTSSSPNISTWRAAVDSGSVPSTIAGGTRSSFGVIPMGVLGMTTGKTKFGQGSSRSHGADTNGGAGDNGMTRAGLNGELPRLLGQDFGVLNGSWNGEGLRHIQSSGNLTCRRKLAARCTDLVIEAVVNDIGAVSGLNNSRTAVATMAGLISGYQAALGLPQLTLCLTASRPAPSSSDNYITLAGQTVNGVESAWNVINNAVRRLAFGNARYYEIANAISSAPDSGLIRVPAGARTINSGTGRLFFTRNDVFDQPGAILNMDAATFTTADNGLVVLIAGAGPGGTTLFAQLGHRIRNDGSPDPNWANLYYYRGYQSKKFITESDIGLTVSNVGGARQANLAFPANTLSIGALQFTLDNLHSSAMGEDLLRPYNAALGLLDIE